jgi:hypothetical protein
MQGLWIDYRRPKSKKEVIETIKTNPEKVSLEATSIFGNEYDGPIKDMPENKVVGVVGPDPYTKRNFYLSITRKNGNFQVK